MRPNPESDDGRSLCDSQSTPSYSDANRIDWPARMIDALKLQTGMGGIGLPALVSGTRLFLNLRRQSIEQPYELSGSTRFHSPIPGDRLALPRFLERFVGQFRQQVLALVEGLLPKRFIAQFLEDQGREAVL